MWTKPIEFGGVVGGSNTGVLGATYYSGSSYEGTILQFHRYEWLSLFQNATKRHSAEAIIHGIAVATQLELRTITLTTFSLNLLGPYMCVICELDKQYGESIH